jgi:hypothetical protein
VSGIGYIQPTNYGTAYKDRTAVFNGFLDWTADYMKKMDMKCIRPVEANDSDLKLYIAKLPFVHSIFPDMGRYSGRSGITNLTYTIDNVPIFRCATTWNYQNIQYNKEGLIPEIREQAGDVRPAFVNGFVHCWTYRMTELEQAYNKRDKDMVFVTPSQLAALYNEAKSKGWTK